MYKGHVDPRIWVSTGVLYLVTHIVGQLYLIVHQLDQELLLILWFLVKDVPHYIHCSEVLRNPDTQSVAPQ
jgi:hypothetical protein